MDKTPKIPISVMSLDLWYEGPTFVVADKPKGMAVHPPDAEGSGTLVNGLLQSNRWLAEMETSHTPGVIHRLMPSDRGLVLVAKSDEMAETLRHLYQNRKVTFSYRVSIPQNVTPRTVDSVTVYDHQVYDDIAVWDIDSPLGDTGELRADWLGQQQMDAYFVCYRMDIPAPQKPIRVGLGERIWLPAIDLYTVPP